jgi:LmbE family N-acetylglucosaminyl deacetylase
VVTTDPATRYAGDSYVNHPDHVAAGEATLAAVIPGSDTRLAYPHLIDEGLEPHKLKAVWLMQNLTPNLIVDISDHMETKVESLRCHPSQLTDADSSLGFVYGMAEWVASAQSFRHGEAFKVIRFDQPWRPPSTPEEAP